MFHVKDNLISGNIVEFVVGKEEAERKENLISKVGNNKIDNFNGAIIQYSLGYSFIEGQAYKDGVPQGKTTRIVRQQRNNSLSGINSNSRETRSTSGTTNRSYTVCYSTYLVTTWPDGSSDWSLMYSYCDSSGSGSETSGGGAGTGYGDPPPPESTDDGDAIPEAKIIYEYINDPCLKSTYNSVTSHDLYNNITNILHNTFGASKDFNIRFVDFNLNNDFLDAKTNAEIWSNGRMDFEVQLNTGSLPNSSKEFAGVTIYHEILHAYLRTTGLEGMLNQHNEMAQSYASKLSSALITAFPTIDPIDAKALAWGGLTGTSAYSAMKANNPAEIDDLEIRNSKHRIHQKGTPCN